MNYQKGKNLGIVHIVTSLFATRPSTFLAWETASCYSFLYCYFIDNNQYRKKCRGIPIATLTGL